MATQLLISRTELMLTMLGIGIRMDMQWKLTVCGFLTGTGIRVMIHLPSRKETDLFHKNLYTDKPSKFRSFSSPSVSLLFIWLDLSNSSVYPPLQITEQRGFFSIVLSNYIACKEMHLDNAAKEFIFYISQLCNLIAFYIYKCIIVIQSQKS